MSKNREVVIGRIEAEGQEVNIVQVQGMVGYRFDAVGSQSLPLAVKFAVDQTQGKFTLPLREKGVR